MSANLVIIEWEDSRQPHGAWKHLANRPSEWRAVKCASVGWLINDDDNCKVLAPNMGDIVDESDLQYSGEIIIPTRCVISIRKLSEGATHRALKRLNQKRKP